ncbi:MAG TPA: TolC family outer membrane protein, partial [Nevskiaceae bacterium]|nr:TolC family outer membrane protein [Nevskiaceae bacterium]
KALEQQLEQAKRRFDVGLSAITDVQDAQARFDATAANVIAGQQAYDAANEALALITGHPFDHLASLQEDIPLPAPDPSDINAWVSAANENNYGLLQARLNSDIADKGVGIARGGHYPSLGLSGREVRSLQGGFNTAHVDSSSVTLSLNVPIFAGGKTQALVRQAEATHEQRQAELELARRTAGQSTRNAYQGVVAGAARVKALKQAVVSNTTAVEASKTGLEVGTRTQVDVLTAEQLLYAAQRDYYKSRYDYLVAVLQLKAAAGRLTEADLEQIDKLLVSG